MLFRGCSDAREEKSFKMKAEIITGAGEDKQKMKKVSEQEILERINKVLTKVVDKETFVKLANEILGTSYKKDEVKWEN